MTVRSAPVPVPAPGAGTSRARSAALLTGAAVVAAGAAGVLAAVDPNAPGHYPTCPFLALTGWWCPGCGSLRAVHALTHGDVATALARNPLAVVALGWLACWYAVQWWRLLADRPRRTMAHPRVLWALGALVAAYWVARNVPGWSWLSPA